MPLKVVQFLALTLTALALVPSGAHLFALPNKINLTFAAFCAVTLSVLTTRERTPTGGVGVTSGERPH